MFLFILFRLHKLENEPCAFLNYKYAKIVTKKKPSRL